MDELTNEQISYDVYQDLIKALVLGVEKIDSEPGRYGIYGIQHLSYARACLKEPEPTGLFKRYHETSLLPEDQYGMPLVWDMEVDFYGEKVQLRWLIEKLESLWNEFRMLNEGGA